MDVFSHGLWSYLIFHKQRWKYWAILVGVLPDLLSWFIFMLYRMVNGIAWGGPDVMTIPQWVWDLYGLSHSLIVFMVVFGVLWLVFRRVQWILLPYLVHILIDIPTHSRHFLPTPFLWPISDWAFPGISWGQRWFMMLNLSLIAIGYAYFLIYLPMRARRRGKSPDRKGTGRKSPERKR
jgi:hypothetical protein